MHVKLLNGRVVTNQTSCISHNIQIIDYTESYILVQCEKCSLTWTYYRTRKAMDDMGVNKDD